MKKAIIIGSTSGIGRELAGILSRQGYVVGISGRRRHLLDELQSALPGQLHSRQIDIAKPSEAMPLLEGLIADMGGVDLIVISAGTGHLNRELQWSLERETIDVNVLGFAAMANIAFHHFQQRGSGHLVGITSIAALRGGRDAPAYNATKAFASNYLEGLRQKAARLGLPITVTDIMPGFVDTAMAQSDVLFWVASPDKTARQIYAAIKKRKHHAYITKRWRLFAWVLKIVPGFIYKRL